MADNTFGTARNLGFLERAGTRPLQVKNTLSRTDRTDILRFTIQPGPAFGARSSFQVNGKANVLLFVNDPQQGQIVKLVGPARISKSRSVDLPFPEIPAGAPPIDFYIKLDRPMQNLKQNVKYTVNLTAI